MRFQILRCRPVGDFLLIPDKLLYWAGSVAIDYNMVDQYYLWRALKKSGVAKPEWPIREEQGWFKSSIASHMREYLKGRNEATVFVVDNEAVMRKALLHPVEIR